MRSIMARMTTAGAALLACGPGLARADAVSEFYAGRSLRMVVSTTVGGSYDTSARLVARHIGRHIPGGPSFILQNMVGASGRLAANYMYNIAPRDGSVLSAAQQPLATLQMLNEGGVEYDVRHFNWIGTPIDPISVIAVWHTSGIRTLEDAKTKEVPIGAAGTAGTNFIYPALANAFFGTKFKIIVGYSGGNQADLAMERGEVNGRGSFVWSFLKVEKPEWIRDRKIVPLAQMSLRKHPDLLDLPRFVDLAGNPDVRKIMEIMSQTSSFGRPILTAPDVPTERVAALRKAFDETMKDPAFLADAENLKFEILPVSGEQLQSYANELLSAPSAIIDLMQASLTRKGGTVPCEKFTDPRYCEKPGQKEQ